jgi:hypothetical protein
MDYSIDFPEFKENSFDKELFRNLYKYIFVTSLQFIIEQGDRFFKCSTFEM